MKKKILAIDIGGTHIKGSVLDADGKIIEPYQRLDTPKPANPSTVIATIKKLAANFSGYNYIAVGFPGYVKDDTVFTAPNLDAKSWNKIKLAQKITAALGKPAKVINDADMQGLGIAKGKGFEMVVTLGTGFGTALLQDGKLMPHLELAHHPLLKYPSYDKYIGDKTLKEIGLVKWNKRMQKVIVILKTVFNYDKLYLSGGNAAKISFTLDKNIFIENNKDGIHGGAKLWK